MPMAETFAHNGVTTVKIGRGTVLLADGTVVRAVSSPEEAVRAAVPAIAAAAGRAVPVLYGEQRHTAVTFVYGQHEPLPAAVHRVGVCDALLTGEPGVALLVVTADCLPVALVGPDVAAMIHAGWRGLAADILGRVVRRLAVEFGTGPETLAAVIGVGIGPCHYPVGPEVMAALTAYPLAPCAWQEKDRVDLGAWAVGRLAALGLPARAILRMPGCTACSRRYASYRRDGVKAGRQWSAVFLGEPGLPCDASPAVQGHDLIR